MFEGLADTLTALNAAGSMVGVGTPGIRVAVGGNFVGVAVMVGGTRVFVTVEVGERVAVGENVAVAAQRRSRRR